jgi:antirestriction protein
MDPPTETDDTELEAAFEEHYVGEYDSVETYGRELLDDLGVDPDGLPGLPEGLRAYVKIDVEAWVRDMQYGGELRTAPSEQGVYVFNCF